MIIATIHPHGVSSPEDVDIDEVEWEFGCELPKYEGLCVDPEDVPDPLPEEAPCDEGLGV